MRQPPEIRQLDDQVANAIAAGEVVERPASVVKELVENALDAGATRIAVKIEDGGRRLVEVVDDGHGMRPADLRAALGRHATSKLRAVDDLWKIGTLGFRGEALPSISAVSELELRSRPHDAPVGHRLLIEGGKVTADEPIATAPGTTVCVRNLFWNVPARLKFLKGQAAEAGAVTDMLARLALGQPAVGFRLDISGREAFDLPAAHDLAMRVRTLFGRDLAEALLPAAGCGEASQVTGFVAHPQQATSGARRQFVWINGRAIRDKVLVAAVRAGFSGYLEPRLHGVVFLHLEMDPALVDVNVHPTKAEVRFRREAEVFHLVRQTVHDTLERHAGGSALLSGAPTPLTPTVVAAPAAPWVSRTVVKPSGEAPPAPAPLIQERFLPQDSSQPGARVAETPPAYAASAPAPRLPPGVRQAVQLANAWILLETDQGLRLIDQHAVHEKALYLALDGRHRDFGGGRQEFLVPVPIALSAGELAAVEPLLPRLAELGIVLEPFGPSTLALRAVPERLARLAWPAFLHELAVAASTDPEAPIARLGERLAHRVACHAAVKAGDRLSEEEVAALVDLLYRIEGTDRCPHGRPAVLDLSWVDLEKRFMR